MKKLLAFLVVFVMVSVLVGCGAGSIDISGEWVATNGIETITYDFSESSEEYDGTFGGTVHVDFPGGSTGYLYRIHSKNNIEVYTSFPTESTIATFKLEKIGGVEVLNSEGLLFFKQDNN